MSLRSQGWKAIWPLAGGAPRLYDLGDDPGELRDLAAARPRRLRTLTALQRRLRGRPVLAEPRSWTAADEESRRKLRALGYL